MNNGTRLMLGNLLDNACKWGRSRIAVSSEAKGGGVVIPVYDDGPGWMRRCVRRCSNAACADEAAPGSGLGLATVRDLAELYGGSIALNGAPSGGLRARLRLPG